MSITWTTDAILRRAVEFGPDRIAVVLGEDGSHLTYGQLDEQVNRLANALRDKGVAKGDRVAVFMENRIEYIVAYHGVARSGGVFVPIVTNSKVAEVEYFISHAEPVAMILDNRRLDLIAEQLHSPASAFASLRHVLNCDGTRAGLAEDLAAALASASAKAPSDCPTPEDAVALMYTSGSTGRPKAVIHSHYTAVAQAEGVSSRMGYTPEDRLMTMFPLYHGNGLVWSALTAVWCCARVIIHRRFSSSSFWDSARRHGATEVNLLLGSINMVLAQPERPDDADNPVRLVLANVTEPLYERFTKRFDVDIVSTWALSEGPLGTMTAPGFGYRDGLIGWPMGTDNIVSVVDDDDVELPVGAVGELVQRNRAVMSGYLKNEAETTRVFKNGWMHSGDLGYRGEDGMFYFVGRQKHVIRRGGENVSGEEVETCIEEHPDVEEAAVIAVPDELRGEEIKAFVVRRDGSQVTPEAIVALCEEKLTDFKVPRYVEFIDKIPRTGPEKPNRPALKERPDQTACWDRAAQQRSGA
jgi:crotonobetaine/carnitine-CoA ligase